MHYHVGTYTERGTMCNAHGYTRSAERAHILADSATEGQRLWHESESDYVDSVNARRMRGAVIDDISDPDYSDREPRPFALPAYRFAPYTCNLPPSRCIATVETIQERRRSRSR